MIVIPVQSATELLPSEHAASSLPTPPPSVASRQTGGRQQQRSTSQAPSVESADDPYSAVSTPSFGKLSKDIARDFGRLYEAVAGARRIVVICGAGISVSAPANIPDFRSSSGLFQKLKDQHPNAGLTSGKDLFDARLFNSEKTSDLFYSMIAELKEMADRAQPTAFHHFLKRLDIEGRLLRVYTQNIDGLEERAGLTFGLKANSPAENSSTALGKRKRTEAKDAPGTSEVNDSMAMAKRAAWARSQSDSAVLWSQRAAGRCSPSSLLDSAKAPMFPRTIPLHGSLNSMTCGRCGHQEILDNAFKSVADSLAEYEAWRLSQSSADTSADTIPSAAADEEAAPGTSSSVAKEQARKVVPELKRLDIHEVLTSLRAGEHIPCPRCETADEVRLAAGLRSRGVGRMKPDVVLYGGQNDGAERVGECLQRDILGLRDPNETAVPETLAEIRHRERREIKEGTIAKRSAEPEPLPRMEAGVNVDADADISLEVSQEVSQDDTLGSIFFADEDEVKAAAEVEDALAPLVADVGTSAALGERPNKLAKTTSKGKVVKPKLKPLPPDLLIVAGTSLKVSGTKRIIREFAKACHARDYRYYPGDDDSDEGDSSTDGDSTSASRRRRQRKRSSSADEDGDGEEDDDEEDDPKAPIRTILLNYEFPAPSSQWEDVFDIWIQGDVQSAARGLWPMPYTNTAFGALPVSEEDEEISNVAACLAGVNPAESWAHLKDHLDEQRLLEKKYKGKSAATLKKKAKEEEATMPPRLMALSLNTLAALPMGAAKPVPLPQLGRKRSFVKSKTTSSIAFGRSVSLSASLSPMSSRAGSLLRDRSDSPSGASESSSLTSLSGASSERSSPALGAQEWQTRPVQQSAGLPSKFEIVITAKLSKGKQVAGAGAGKAAAAAAAAKAIASESAVVVGKGGAGTPKSKRTVDVVTPSKGATPGKKSAASTPKKASTPVKKDSAAPKTKVATPSKKAATPTVDAAAAAAPAAPKKRNGGPKKAVSASVAAKPKGKVTASGAPSKKAAATVKATAGAQVKKAAAAAAVAGGKKGKAVLTTSAKAKQGTIGFAATAAPAKAGAKRGRKPKAKAGPATTTTATSGDGDGGTAQGITA
ncbi:hypothetical protein OC835_003854 [Tilletia horrida]|nr:hypothetical protein OC835_003854 [Tilletia horrida]